MKNSMKSKIGLLALTLAMSLFANTETLKPQETKVEIKPVDNMSLSIDCTYDKHWKYTEYFRIDKDINDLMGTLCNDKIQGSRFEITYSDFKKKIDSFIENEHFKIDDSESILEGSDKYITYKGLIDITNKNLIYHLYLYRSGPLANIYIEKDFFIASISNMPIKLEHRFVPRSNWQNFSTYENYLIKNYKYDFENNKIDSFELDRPFKSIGEKTFSNTYNIDNETECINGIIWIKKYGAKSDDKCKWVEKIQETK